MPPLPFRHADSIDVAAAAAQYGATGAVSLQPFLPEDQAEALRAHLAAREDWLRVMNAGEKVYEMPRAALAELTVAERETLDRHVAEAAIDGFQYRYEAIRVADDDDARGDTLLDRFREFLSAPETIATLRAITGTSPDFADAQATSYTAGDFLTRHDDDVVGKHRHAAYVYGLTHGWRAEWGGLLLFHGPETGGGADIERGFAPAFNALRLFRVPAVHSVSPVWPFAPKPRLSVTGWLRSNPQCDEA